jgi:uncharacterized membrane protein
MHPRTDTGASGDEQLGVLLACFDGRKTAGKARRSLETQVRAEGDELLDTIVLEVDEKHKATTHDPRKVRRATVTAALVWGATGLAAANGLWSVLFWGAVGAIGGALFMYYSVRHLTKSELARIGSRLPSQSSALAVWVGTRDARRLLETAATQKPSVASAASIGADLTTHVFAGPTDPVEVPPGAADKGNGKAVLIMVMLRYPSPETAQEMASHPPVGDNGDVPALDVEMVIRSDADGRRHVSDPSLGVRAAAKSELFWWGGFGLVFGALAGAVGGGGVLGFIEGGLETAVVWALVGLGVGVLYGLVVLRSVSARSLKGVGSLSTPGTSILMAWADAASPLTESALDPFMKPGSQRLVLNFNSSERGAVLDATSSK